MRRTFEAVRAARAPWVESWARVQALDELVKECYRFRVFATETKQPPPKLKGPPAVVHDQRYSDPTDDEVSHQQLCGFACVCMRSPRALLDPTGGRGRPLAVLTLTPRH